MNSINFDILLLQEGDVHIALCPNFGTVDQGTTQEEAVNNLLQTTHIFLQESKKANIYSNFVVQSEILNLPVPSLPQVSACRVIAILERLGFRRTSQCVVLRKQTNIGEITCAVPLRYPLASPTIWNLLYFAGISGSEFLDAL